MQQDWPRLGGICDRFWDKSTICKGNLSPGCLQEADFSPLTTRPSFNSRFIYGTFCFKNYRFYGVLYKVPMEKRLCWLAEIGTLHSPRWEGKKNLKICSLVLPGEQGKAAPAQAVRRYLAPCPKHPFLFLRPLQLLMAKKGSWEMSWKLKMLHPSLQGAALGELWVSSSHSGGVFTQPLPPKIQN